MEWQMRQERLSGARLWKADCPAKESGLYFRPRGATEQFLKQGVTR